MVARIVLAIAACVVAVVVVFTIFGSRWAPRPAPQPNAPASVQVPHNSSDETGFIRNYVTGPLVPTKGARQW